MKIHYGRLALGMLVAGCTTIGTEPTPSEAESVTGALDPERKMILTAIEKPQIPEGECGMVLWTLDAERPMAVFRFVSGKAGEVVLDGISQRLTLQDRSGAAGYGVHEGLTFTGENAISLNVSVQFGSGFEGGSYVQRGLITAEDADGWRSVTPVAGIAGCRG